MKNKLLWLILPAILTAASCKKDQRSSPDNLVQQSQIVGDWKPFKVVTEIVNKNEIIKKADSSEYVPRYTLDYHIEKDFLVSNEKQSSYKLSKDGEQLFLEYKIFDIDQKVPVISLSTTELVLQRLEMIGDIKKTETVYYKK